MILRQAPQVMTLDLGTTCGWVLGRAGTRPQIGTWRLKGDGDSRETAARNLVCHMRDLWAYKDDRPDVLVIEEPMSGKAVAESGHSNSKSGDFMWLLYGAAAGITGPYGIRCRYWHVMTARKAVLGSGRPKNPKRAVLDAVRMRGYDLVNHNAADALVGWLYWTSVHHTQMLLEATEDAPGTATAD